MAGTIDFGGGARTLGPSDPVSAAYAVVPGAGDLPGGIAIIVCTEDCVAEIHPVANPEGEFVDYPARAGVPIPVFVDKVISLSAGDAVALSQAFGDY